MKKNKKSLNKLNQKKAISPIIGTVLLIGITVSLFIVLFGIVVPLVTDKLDSGACYEYLDYIKIIDSEYTCYNLTSSQTSLDISRSHEEKEITSIQISLSNSNSRFFEIYDNKTGVECDLTSSGVGPEEYKCAPKPGHQIVYDFDFEQAKTAYLSIKLEGGSVCGKISSISNIKMCY